MATVFKLIIEDEHAVNEVERYLAAQSAEILPK